MQSVYFGNVNNESTAQRGWFIGHFIEDKDSLRFSQDVEMKWGIHQKGERRDEWSVCATATTMSLVVQGQMRMIFREQEMVLKPGDYYISQPQVEHKYVIEEDSVILTVRWPSLPNDHQNLIPAQ